MERNRELLALQGLNIVRADALQFLEQPPTPFDIVFLDPPFDNDLLGAVCQRLTMGWLAQDARIYLEEDLSRDFPVLPEDWKWLKQKTAGRVRYGLAQTALLG